MKRQLKRGHYREPRRSERRAQQQEKEPRDWKSLEHLNVQTSRPDVSMAHEELLLA